MELVRKERKEEYTVYVAADGTEFSQADYCQVYEESVTAILLARLNECTIKKDVSCYWWDENDEHQYSSISPKTMQDIDTLNMLWKMYAGKDQKELRFTKKDIGKLFLIGRRMDGNSVDWLWVYDFDEMVSNITDNKFYLYSAPED